MGRKKDSDLTRYLKENCYDNMPYASIMAMSHEYHDKKYAREMMEMAQEISQSYISSDSDSINIVNINIY